MHGWKEEEDSVLACVAIPQNHLPAVDTGPSEESRVLSSSADPSSLIYSLFYLYILSRTLSEQMIEAISPR